MNSKITVKTIAGLKLAGWTYVGSVMVSEVAGCTIAYGLKFIKEGKKFYFNKDTYIDTMTPDQNAECCSCLFK